MLTCDPLFHGTLVGCLDNVFGIGFSPGFSSRANAIVLGVPKQLRGKSATPVIVANFIENAAEVFSGAETTGRPHTDMSLANKYDVPRRVSVVVPTWGRAQLLKNCFQSLLAQDYPKDHFEILIGEDGTNEAEKIVIECIDGSTVPVQYVWIPHDGIAVARNAGAEKSTGEIVAYIDDDALAAPRWLKLLVEALHVDRAGGAGGHVSPEYPDDSLVSEVEEDGRMKFPVFPLRPGACSAYIGIHDHREQNYDWTLVPALVIEGTPLTHFMDECAGVLNIPCSLESLEISEVYI